MLTFLERPSDFRGSSVAAGCFIESSGRLLYLKRAPSRIAPNTWCIPGGKLEPGETPRAAIIREVLEEVGLSIDTPDLQHLGPLYLRHPDYDYIFHVFHKPLPILPTLQLNPEHTAFQWITPAQAPALPLIPGGPEALLFYLQRKTIPV